MTDEQPGFDARVPSVLDSQKVKTQNSNVNTLTGGGLILPLIWVSVVVLQIFGPEGAWKVKLLVAVVNMRVSKVFTPT